MKLFVNIHSRVKLSGSISTVLALFACHNNTGTRLGEPYNFHKKTTRLV